MFFITQFGITFIAIFLKANQTHNVINFDYKGAAFTSALMSISNVVFIGLAAHDPVASILPVALGSILGVLVSMRLKARANKIKDKETN